MAKFEAYPNAIDKYGHVHHYEFIKMLWQELKNTIMQTDYGSGLCRLLMANQNTDSIERIMPYFPESLEVDFVSQSYEGEIMQIFAACLKSVEGIVHLDGAVRYAGENYSPDYVIKKDKAKDGLVARINAGFFKEFSSHPDFRNIEKTIFADYLAQLNTIRENVFEEIGIRGDDLIGRGYAVPVIRVAYKLTQDFSGKNFQPEFFSVMHPKKTSNGKSRNSRSTYEFCFISGNSHENPLATAIFRICFLKIENMYPIKLGRPCRPPDFLKERIENHPRFYR